jgi:signal transduction histidine kinase
VPRDLAEENALCLYRVAQESLHNAGKHAQASMVHVRLAGGPTEIVMEVEDLGSGFEWERIRGKGGLGLVSMEERVRLLKGRFRVRSQLGKGTCVEVRIPLPRPDSQGGK